jgi:hypothetical protein
MADVPTALSEITKHEGVLHALYSDLAAPGVKLVGLALETVLKTGNILLLPFRMLNEYAAASERRNFKEIAARFSKIHPDDVVDVRPEIGVPILEKISITEDPDLKRLFVELLATAADKNKVGSAHPSFVRVIENLSPDEAKILKAWKGQQFIPSLIVKELAKDSGTIVLRDLVVTPPSGVSEKSMLSPYMANLAGLGILRTSYDAWLTEEGIYEPDIELARDEFPCIKEGGLLMGLGNDPRPQEGDTVYQKGYIEILSYGRLFQQASMA